MGKTSLYRVIINYTIENRPKIQNKVVYIRSKPEELEQRILEKFNENNEQYFNNIKEYKINLVDYDYKKVSKFITGNKLKLLMKSVGAVDIYKELVLNPFEEGFENECVYLALLKHWNVPATKEKLMKIMGQTESNSGVSIEDLRKVCEYYGVRMYAIDTNFQKIDFYVP
jgi:hypothetical protein